MSRSKAKAAKPSKDHAKRRRRRRRLHHVAVATLLGFALGFVLVTRAGLLRYIILPKVEALLDCEASCGRVLMATSGDLILYDFEIDAPQTDGPASRVLYARKVQVQLALDSWWPGSLTVKGIQLFDPVVRISQAEDLSLNLAPIFSGGSAPAGGGEIPEVEIVDGTLELGEHGAGNYVPVVSLKVQGGIQADASIDGLYRIKLSGDPRKLPGARAAARLDAKTSVEGFLDLANGAFSLTADNINLSELAAQSAPRSFRGYWEELKLRGLIPTSTLTYAPADGLAAEFGLEGVDLAIPVPVTEEEEIEGVTQSSLRAGSLDMHEVTGGIRFDRTGLHASLTGLVEDLACRVQFDTEGLSIDAPLSCSIGTDAFKIESGQKPRLLPFAPAFAQRVFRRFASPEATLEGHLIIERVVDEAGDSQWLYDGKFNLKDGQARYEQFPYPFVNVEATFEFDQDKFEMPLIRGVGRGTGASLLASGVIAPPGVEAQVDVDVTVVDLPMDDTFVNALPESSRSVFNLLFNQESYRAHVESGRIVAPEHAAQLELERENLVARIGEMSSAEEAQARDDVAALQARLEEVDVLLARRFELGGKARLKLNIHRPLGPDQRYATDIDFRVPQAGIVPAAFPYPSVATDVVITMTEGMAEIPSFNLKGLSGAQGTLSGTVAYPNDVDGTFSPELHIKAEGVPLDDLLVDALPSGPIDTGDGATTSREMLTSLALGGTVSCDATVAPDEDGQLGFSVDITLEDLRAQPDERLTFEHVEGAMTVTDESIDIERISGLVGGSPFTLALRADFTGDEEEQRDLSGRVDVRAMDVERPIESILRFVAPDRMRVLEDLRAAHQPTGTLDAALEFSEHGGQMVYALEASNMADLAFDFEGARVRLAGTRGKAVISHDAVRFDGFEADVIDGVSVEPAHVKIDGRHARRANIAGELSVSIESGHFQSPLVRAAAWRDVGGARAAFEKWNPGGRFDLTAERRTFDDGSAASNRWVVEPKELSFEHGGQTVVLDAVEGRVTGGDTGGTVEQVRFGTSTWSASADGTWSKDPAPSADLIVELEASGIDDDLVAAMPANIADVLKAIDLKVSERVRLGPSAIRYRAGASEGEERLGFDGELSFSGLSARAGVPFTDARGTATISYELLEGAGKPDFDVQVESEAFMVLGVEMTGGHARMGQGSRADVHLLRSFEAFCNGGRVTARAAFADAREMGLEATGRSYEIQAEVTGVRFGPMLEQMSRARRGESQGDTETESEIDRGRLDASFSLFGAFSSDETRRGRGTVRVEGGDVLNMPGILPLLELSNLQAPASEKVDLAFTDFFIDGDRLLFDKLYMYSPSIRITGEGQMRWSTTGLDLRVQTRGMRQIPLLSEIFTSVREEIVSTRVTGTLYDPEFRYEQLSGARRLFDTMLGGSGDERDER